MGDNLDSDLGPCQFDYISAYEDAGAWGFLMIFIFLLWASYLVHLCELPTICCNSMTD